MNRPPLREILYVEDNPKIRAIAKIALETVGGFSLQMCESGTEALAAVAAGAAPDLLLLDVMLPGMDGPTILERLRELPRTAQTPVIFMTAKVQQHEIAYYESLGALGVVTKPFDPMLLPAQLHRLWNSGPAPARDMRNVQEKLQSLRSRFIEDLPRHLDALRHLLDECGRRGAGVDDLEALHNLLHTLAGTAGTFGFDELSNEAKRVELRVQAERESGSDASGAFARLLDELQVFAAWAAGKSREGLTTAPEAAWPASGLAPPDAHVKAVDRLVYLVSTDAPAAADIAAQLGHFGYRIELLARPEQIESAVERNMPIAIVLDCPSREATQSGCTVIERLRLARGSLCALIVISACGDFAARHAALKAGADGYFLRPVDVMLLTERLGVMTRQQAGEPYRVLIVEDDMATAEYCDTILRQADMHTVVLQEPETVLEVLEKFRPELILMDLYMPKYSGADLASLIRQDNTWLDIPIIFLSNEQSVTRQIDAIRSGADYFLTKPITPQHLVSSLTSRAERYRSLRGLIMRDSLTGLYNHSAITEHLRRELARAARTGAPLAFAMIDIDHFKRVNDTHGHPAGDQVIRALARVMQQRLRHGDLVGRYGGEEFSAILPSTTADAAIGVLDDVRNAFSSILHHAGGSEFTVTFSAGVAGAHAESTAESLLQAADAALYRAKRKGRNRVELA